MEGWDTAWIPTNNMKVEMHDQEDGSRQSLKEEKKKKIARHTPKVE